MSDLNENYRIGRRQNNIVIERFAEKRWKVVSYHGSSLSSLITGLHNVMMAQHTPTDAKLSEQLEKLRLELVSSVGQVEKMIKEADLDNKNE